MKSARLPASRLPTSRSRPSTNAGLYVAIAMAWAGEKRMCEHAMLIIIGIDSHVELPGLKSVAMASRIPADHIARAGAKSSDGSPKLVPGKRTPKTPAAAIEL